MKYLLIIALLIISGCSSRYFDKIEMEIPLNEVEGINNYFIEKGFCLKENGHVHEVAKGTFFTSAMPRCPLEDFVMHTHPFIAYGSPNWFDLSWDYKEWNRYFKQHKNRLFGVYKNWKLYLFQRKEQ